MANTLWSQDTFSKGELSPLMYARSSVEQYYNGLKRAKNVLCYPQGAAGKRFGTLFNSELNPAVTSRFDIFFQTFAYLNECIYQLLFRPDAIDIYLEGLLVATVTGTGLDGQTVYNLDSTILQNRFRVAGQGFRPRDLVRAPNAPITIASVADNEIVLGAPGFTAGLVFPVRFTTTGTLPVTTPQIKIGVTYFIFTTSTTTAKLYFTSEDAKNDVDAITITSLGTGINNVVLQNSWTFVIVTFKNLPVYDFDGGYDALSFTPAAVSGVGVALTASGPIFTATMVGGAFIGAGGVARITGVSSPTVAIMDIQQPFDSTAPIPGRVALLAEPAWSDLRGWPQKCSSYQNRSLFANTDSLPNGFWASAINDYSDFNDLQTDDDDAISWFPTSDDINYIRFIVPYRSVTVHTNSGIYSSPLSVESAITPKTFSLQLQDSTPADVLQPTAIDNQIIVISGNDVHSMIWEGINNAYTSEIVSIMNEQLIRSPVDETPYIDFRRAGSRYVFIINDAGDMAIFQTLLTENVKGFTPAQTEQSYGGAFFRQIASSVNGRAWFIVERQIAEAAAPIAITGFTSSTLTAVASAFSTTTATPIKFTTTGTLPTSNLPLNITDYFWAKGVTVDTFKVYLTSEDAVADEDALIFSSAGTNSNVVAWPLANKFYLEELTFDTFLDCAVHYEGVATETVTNLARFNAQEVKMVGDGFGFNAIGSNDSVVFKAHGEEVPVSNAYIGFPIKYVVETLPLTISMGSSIKNTTLTRPKHIRNVNFMFNNTIGGTINGVPIALNTFNQTDIGRPPTPARGVFGQSMMKGWNDFDNPTFTIEHDEPFDIQLLGIFYDLDF